MKKDLKCISGLVFLSILLSNFFCYSQNKLERQSSSIVYLYVDKLPLFSGGNGELKRFINTNLRWPQTELDVQGSVLISFIVTKSGNIENPKIERSLFKTFDDEAIRVIKLMPKWKAGEFKKNRVNVKLYLPIDFFLKD